MRKPRQRTPRNNPKLRKVEMAPAGVDLQQVARLCRYVGSPYHGVSIDGRIQSVRRPDATICPKELINNPGRVEAWLRQAVEAGHAGGWGRRYPRRAWHRDQDGDTIYEAREGSPGSGEYHGYPLQPTQEVQGLP